MHDVPYRLIETPAGAFAGRATQLLSSAMQDAIEEKGQCVVGLSGGSTPRPIYEALATEKEIDWFRVWLFLIDERYIPGDHPDSNLRLVRETLLHDAGTYEAEHLLHPQSDLSLDACVETYGRDLRSLFDDKGRPDLVVLGMGEDGHTASLFPPLGPEAFGPALAIHTVTDRFAVRNRISVTMPVLEHAHQKIFLLKGEGKKKALNDMVHSSDDVHRWPAKALLTARTTILWSA